jgi:hypothetical protein
MRPPQINRFLNNFKKMALNFLFRIFCQFTAAAGLFQVSESRLLNPFDNACSGGVERGKNGGEITGKMKVPR